ncbi:mediator of RNA polymerase II transcription subunit 28 [Bactrocera neohumeralis]|uniref:mediator of RNA polymerase II transcription subunit 28 n=1 Tax=Bactrocera tryoni TaxID=59916 RepID=UPI001A96ECDB|nr:mediator of RNA polymerase II transcription subunit 28 [Bactrocera tryoni]XP_050317383.1 mediator of RNA polymerase II transcription subunit 28 [Bactrocera neohumeralis]
MSSSNNDNGNLMDEFEEAFQACLLSLTKPEPNTGTNKDEIELEVQKTTNRFIDVARQMEAFFLQKRFLVSTLKPDMLIKDENQDLRNEIARKEQLLNKHYSRLEEWKACLSDIQANQGAHNRPIGGIGGAVAAIGDSSSAGTTGIPGIAGPGSLNIPQVSNRSGSVGMLGNVPAYGVPRRF